MASISHHGVGNGRDERRSDCRYPINAEVEYILRRRQRVAESGRGQLVNISGGGILFKSAGAIPPRMGIELFIAWPARPSNVSLFVAGRTVRSEGTRTAVKILRYEFRTRP